MHKGLLRWPGELRPETCDDVVAMFSVRSSVRFRRRSPRRGVSLVELLIVLAILGLIFGMAGILIGPPLKKARLASAANDLAVLMQRAAVEARTQRGGQGLFVYIKGTPATRTFELLADTGGGGGGDGVYQDPSGGAPPDSVIANVSPVRLPAGIVFHNLPAPYNNCWSNWGVSGVNFVLGLDYQGRTVGPGAPGAPGRQINGFAAVNLTHADMASGLVTPLVVHRLTIGPVWGVRHTRLVRDAAAASGWREY